MKAILIDDEQLAIDVLEILLHKIEGVEIVGKFTDPQVALEKLPALEVDLVFLDMEMGELHGLEFAGILDSTYPHLEIIFVTAYPQFALEAFEVNAIDYLLKPVDQERLDKTVHKLKRRVAGRQNNQLQAQEKEVDLFTQVMGDFHLLDKERNEVKWRTKKVKELFILLWHHKDQGIHRSQIIMDLWPELPEDRASALMHTTVYQLRKVIREIGFEKPVILRNGQYVLDVPVKSDLDQLKSILTLSEINRSTIEDVIGLYRGDYLDVEDYHWALSAQEMMRELFLNYLEKYVSMTKGTGKEGDLVENCLKRMLQLEPYKTQYTYLLLEYYGETRNTQKMVALFQEAKTKWIVDLGLDMPKELVELYSKYLKL